MCLLTFTMRAAGLSVYCFTLSPSLNKVDTCIHQSKKCAKLTQALGLSWKTRWQLMLTISFWQSIAKLIWIPENLVYENHVTDYSNRTEWAIDKPWPCQFNSRMHKYFSLVYAPVLHLKCFKTKLTPMFNMEKHSRYCRF